MKSIHISEELESVHLFENLKYCHLNTNPLNNKTGDCYIRAIAILSNISWDEAFTKLFEMAFSLKLSINDPTVIFRVLQKYGFRQISPDLPSTFYELSKNKLFGRYLVFVPRHVYPILDSVCYDTVMKTPPTERIINKMKEEKILMILHRIA